MSFVIARPAAPAAQIEVSALGATQFSAPAMAVAIATR